MAEKKYNPRYEAFCRAHDMTVEEMFELKREGTHLSFSLWLRPLWREFEGEVAARGIHICRVCRFEFETEFDVWLQERF